MTARMSVNQALERLGELEGQPVEIVGLLTFETENISLWHFPKSEQRSRAQAGSDTYPSSLWLAAGTGSIQFNDGVLTRWNGKRVTVVGILRGPGKFGGCGHWGCWGAEVEVYSIERGKESRHLGAP